MEKIPLHILSLFPSPVREDVFTLLLGEVDGPRQLPLLLGAPEAQAMVLALEGARLERPLTHDLFQEVLLKLHYSVQEVTITAFSNHIFLAQMTLSDGDASLTVDARPSDAITLAIHFEAALYIEATLFEQTALPLATSLPTISYASVTKSLEEYPLATLQQLLQEVVAKEAYEQAALLRDEINRRSALLDI